MTNQTTEQTQVQTQKKSKITTVRLAKMAMLIAVSIVLVALIHFPIFPAVAFLEYDPADIPILIGTFAFGPVAGVLLTIVTAIIQGTTVSAASGVYGILMHIIATSALVITAGLIYKYNKTRKGAVIALICGVIAMTVVMIGANMVITPIFISRRSERSPLSIASPEVPSCTATTFPARSAVEVIPLSFFTTST